MVTPGSNGDNAVNKTLASGGYYRYKSPGAMLVVV